MKTIKERCTHIFTGLPERWEEHFQKCHGKELEIEAKECEHEGECKPKDSLLAGQHCRSCGGWHYQHKEDCPEKEPEIEEAKEKKYLVTQLDDTHTTFPIEIEEHQEHAKKTDTTRLKSYYKKSSEPAPPKWVFEEHAKPNPEPEKCNHLLVFCKLCEEILETGKPILPEKLEVYSLPHDMEDKINEIIDCVGHILSKLEKRK